MGLDTPTPWETVQGSRVLAIGRRLQVLVHFILGMQGDSLQTNRVGS